MRRQRQSDHRDTNSFHSSAEVSDGGVGADHPVLGPRGRTGTSYLTERPSAGTDPTLPGRFSRAGMNVFKPFHWSVATVTISHAECLQESFITSPSVLWTVSVCKMEPNDRRKTTPDMCWRSRPTNLWETFRTGWRQKELKVMFCQEDSLQRARGLTDGWRTLRGSEDDFSCWSCDYVLKFRVCKEPVRNPKHRARRCWSVTTML